MGENVKVEAKVLPVVMGVLSSVGDCPKETGELPQLHGHQYTHGANAKDHALGYCKNFKKGTGTMRVVKRKKLRKDNKGC